MENFILGVLAGGFVVGTTVLVILMTKVVSMVSEALTIIKTIYIEGTKTQQMVGATMQASENFVDALRSATENVEEQNKKQQFFQIFRSEDGKYQASSLEGLLEKLKNAPEYKEMNEKDIDDLRRMFEENTEDDEDEDDQIEPWRKQK